MLRFRSGFTDAERIPPPAVGSTVAHESCEVWSTRGELLRDAILVHDNIITIVRNGL